MELLGSLPDGATLAYTDGSVLKNPRKASCGVFIPELGVAKGWILRHPSSSFVAELQGIKMALTELYQHELPDIFIITDSKAAIVALRNINSKSHSVVLKIWDMVQNFSGSGSRVSFVWIPGHAGIPGNEEADKLANEAHKNDDIGAITINNQLSSREHVATLKQKSVTSWLNEIKEETTSAIVSQYSSLTPQKWMIHNDRKIHSALIKLRTKHNGLKHNTSRHFHTIDEEDNEADPWCRFGCPKREDEDHLLLDCPQFESHRNKLKSHLADLKGSFSSKILLGLEKN